LIQSFYTQERTFVITGANEKGQSINTPLTINQEAPDATGIINDVTVGKYDVVIADVPTQITFQNAQFSQAIEMRKFGVQIPDDEMVRMSTLSRKNEIAKKIEGGPSEEQQKLQDQQVQLQLEQMRKAIEELEAKAKDKEASSLKQVAEVATLIAQNPGLASIMDTLMGTIEKEELSKSESNEQEVSPVPPQPRGLGQI
jgi:hypothetical protein